MFANKDRCVPQDSGVLLTRHTCPVFAGFPSPAQDYVDKPLCLNELLVPRPCRHAVYPYAG